MVSYFLYIWSSLIVIVSFFTRCSFVLRLLFLILKQFYESIIRHVFPLVCHIFSFVFYVIVLVLGILFIKSLFLVLSYWRTINILVHIFHIWKAHISESLIVSFVVRKLLNGNSLFFAYFLIRIIFILI
jgi:hypothetical protein